jgi:arsenate reductase
VIRFYGYDRCGTCRKAKQQLAKWGLEYRDVDITESPPPKRLLRALLDDAGYRIGDLFNRSGQQYRELGMKERMKQLSEAELLELLAANGRLCKRPVVSDGTRHTVGFDPERFARIWRPT